MYDPFMRLSGLLVALCLMSARAESASASSSIGKADLDEARRLLSEARNELEPQQWALLDSKLVEAERAWERFNQLASQSGKAAEVARSAEGIAEAKRIRDAEGFRAPSRIGPLLALLILLWPSSTAGPAYDELPPALKARQELEAKLREVAKASQQVGVEIEAARKRPPKDAPRPGPKEQPKLVPERGPKPQPGGQGQPPGDEPPCELKGSGGPGQFKPAGPPVITCRYWCGDVQVILTDVWGTSPSDCEHPNVLKRAMRTAAELRRQNTAKKPKDGL